MNPKKLSKELRDKAIVSSQQISLILAKLKQIQQLQNNCGIKQTALTLISKHFPETHYLDPSKDEIRFDDITGRFSFYTDNSFKLYKDIVVWEEGSVIYSGKYSNLDF